MKKYIFLILFTFCFFFSFGHVSALSTSQYTYNSTTQTYTNNYTITQMPLQGWQFNICNTAVYCQTVDLTSFIQNDYAEFSLSSIESVFAFQGGNTNNIYFTVYFSKYSSKKTSLVYSYNDYFLPRRYLLAMPSSSYPNRRILGVTDILQTGKVQPTEYGYTQLKMGWTFVYNFTTNSFTSTTSPSSLGSILIDNNITNLKINYASNDIFNTDTGYTDINSNIYYSNNWVSSLPDYLTGYDKIDFNSRYKFMFISKSTSGYIYIKKTDYETYKPILNYYDVALLSQPFTSVLKWELTNDGLYYRAYYDLASYSGSDFISLTKYANDFAGETNKIAYYVFVPTGAAVSMSLPVAKNDGNTIDYKWTDADGTIHDGTVTNGDITNNNYGLNTAIDQLDKQFGFLFYPFELINNVLNRYQELSATSDFTIHIPDIKEPFYSQTLISAQDFSFSTLYENTVFNYIHELIYLVTDVIIILKLCSLFLKKFNTIIGGESNV